MRKISFFPVNAIVFFTAVLFAGAFSLHTSREADTYMVTTLAGYSDNGNKVDGKGDKAGFSSDVGALCTDAEGNVYVLDDNSLRKISPDGTVTSLLGEYIYDQERNPLQLPALGFANGICMDNSGNFYVSSGNNNSIKKISGQKTITLYAGDNGYKGGDDGPATGSGFYNPIGICIDRSGNIYVADTYNYKVRKISADGKTVTTLAGKGQSGDYTTGTGKAAVFAEFRCIATDSKGNVYIEQNGRGSCIARISPAGVVTTFAGDIDRLAGEGKDGTGKAADFFRINALAFDAQDNLYVGENYRVRKITPAGAVTTIAGINEPQWRDAVGPKARFGMIRSITTDAKGSIYVGDSYCVRKIVKQ